jgi:hypothetical protein
VRDEDTLRHYFDHYLHQYRERKERGMGILGKVGDVSKVPVILQPDKLLKKQSEPKGSAVVTVDGSDEGVELDMDDEEHETEVDEVILVRKLGSVASLRARRTGVLKQLEVVGSAVVRQAEGSGPCQTRSTRAESGFQAQDEDFRGERQGGAPGTRHGARDRKSKCRAEPGFAEGYHQEGAA